MQWKHSDNCFFPRSQTIFQELAGCITCLYICLLYLQELNLIHSLCLSPVLTSQAWDRSVSGGSMSLIRVLQRQNFSSNEQDRAWLHSPNAALIVMMTHTLCDHHPKPAFGSFVAWLGSSREERPRVCSSVAREHGVLLLSESDCGRGQSYPSFWMKLSPPISCSQHWLLVCPLELPSELQGIYSAGTA